MLRMNALRLLFFCVSFALCAPCFAWPTPSSLETYIERVEPHRAVICDILTDEGLSCDWIALALAESGGDPSNVSPKGAAGMWQLMPATARHYGLRVDAKIDERLDVEESTRAAARYIKKHLETFHGSIEWAVAAYNAGGSNLRRKTGYRKGMSIDIVKRVSYPSYALAKTVKAIMEDACQRNSK